MRQRLPVSRDEGYSFLRVSQTAYISVYADKTWNDSGIDVVSGQIYSFHVPGGQKWRGERKTCGADGYRSAWFMRPWEGFRRAPAANWLQLIATIGQSGRHPILIGSSLADFLPDLPGRLYFFANHLPWTGCFLNGMIAVRVTRKK
jgi:hypothetical protein